jgi:hypothetical protein
LRGIDHIPRAWISSPNEFVPSLFTTWTQNWTETKNLVRSLFCVQDFFCFFAKTAFVIPQERAATKQV